MTNKKPKISIIIPTKNRLQDIIKCIESILIQTLLPDEIVIVDSSDTEELKSNLDDLLHDKTAFKYIHAPLSLTQARNVGIKESTGDIIIFLDDDVILDKEYIKEIMHVFNNDLEKKVGGVTGNIINAGERQNSFKYIISSNIMNILATMFFLFKFRNGKFQPSGWPTFVRKGVDKITSVECLSGSNMAFRREIFNEFEFDENLKGYSFMEDDDISYRVSRKYQNIYTPFARLIHNVSPAARDKEYERMKMTVENHYYLFKKNFPQTLKHKFAFWWSVVGVFVMAMINRNGEGLRGLKDGLINIICNREIKKKETG